MSFADLLVKVRRAIALWQASLPEPTPAIHISSEKCILGVVLSGGEFTPGGSYPDHYGYPGPNSIDYYASKGMSVIRLPFLWERVQPVMNGPLDDIEMARIDEVVNYAIVRNIQVGLDVHNGGRGYGNLIGGPLTPDAAFADLWGKLATHWKDKPNTLFMLMSEPSDQSAAQWLRSANAAIAAIRQVGARQTVVVPGSYWDGAWTWTDSDNAAVVGAGVIDPLNNYMFEAHQYLDKDGSGGTSGIVSPTIGPERLADATEWARAKGMKFFLGEFATAADPISLTALDKMLVFLEQNGDVWMYATWWGGGDRWGNYMFSIEPVSYSDPVDKPQMSVLQNYIEA